jgi:23S rRNA-/tRNA-specific pseudouridylate synthase
MKITVPKDVKGLETKSTTPKQLNSEETKKVRSLVIYKDEDFIAINKPAGLATQGMFVGFKI